MRVGEYGDTRVEISRSEGEKWLIKEIAAAERYVPNELRAEVGDVGLPAVAGRSYLSTPESSVKLPDGSVVVGTHDTMLAHVRESGVFSLGQVCTAGGVHSLDCTSDGVVWGVAGHMLGVGQLFTYNNTEGVKLLGVLPEVMSDCGRYVTIYRPKTLALSPDGKHLAVGGDDELGGLLILDI